MPEAGDQWTASSEQSIASDQEEHRRLVPRALKSASCNPKAVRKL